MKNNIIIILLLLLFSTLLAEKAIIRIQNPSEKSVRNYYKTADVAAYIPGKYIDLVVPVAEAQELAEANPEITITQTETQLKQG